MSVPPQMVATFKIAQTNHFHLSIDSSRICSMWANGRHVIVVLLLKLHNTNHFYPL